MEENPRETHATEEEMLLGGESQASRAPRRDRNIDIIERTLALAKRAEDLSGEVTVNSAEEAGALEQIKAFKAHMTAGVKMGQELLALFKG